MHGRWCRIRGAQGPFCCAFGKCAARVLLGVEELLDNESAHRCDARGVLDRILPHMCHVALGDALEGRERDGVRGEHEVRRRRLGHLSCLASVLVLRLQHPDDTPGLGRCAVNALQRESWHGEGLQQARRFTCKSGAARWDQACWDGSVLAADDRVDILEHYNWPSGSRRTSAVPRQVAVFHVPAEAICGNPTSREDVLADRTLGEAAAAAASLPRTVSTHTSPSGQRWQTHPVDACNARGVPQAQHIHPSTQVSQHSHGTKARAAGSK